MNIEKTIKLLDCIANFRDENGDLPFGTIDYHSISDCQNELRANARLIAAAPELLQALEGLTDKNIFDGAESDQLDNALHVIGLTK